MPRKAFVADLDALARPGGGCCRISDIRRGDDDGSVKFVFTDAAIAPAGVEITAMIPELSDYPNAHQVFLFTESPDVPECVAAALRDLDASGKTLAAIVTTVCRTLRGASTTTDGAADAADSDEAMATDSDDDDDGYDSGGGWSDHSASSSHSHAGAAPDAARQRALRHSLRDDLRALKAAGYKAGVLGDHRGGVDLYIAVGLRIAKLGVGEEALAAWNLDRKKYLVVLLHYSNYYMDLPALCGEETYHASKYLQIVVGTHRGYKPTLEQAIAAFTQVQTEAKTVDKEDGEGEVEGAEEEVKGEDGFRSIFISGPLKDLLNNRLLTLIKYRKMFGMGWDGAELFYDEHQGRDRFNTEHPDEKYYETTSPKTRLSKYVTADALSGATPASSVSFPLLTMQLTLRHLVRCTDFCLVCHNKVSTDFEALKPYVCSNPLCLYQYMSLGFGPRIEHELLHQPAVVDLLVCFCYAAAKAHKLATFPTGMNLLVPAAQSWPAQFHRAKNELSFPDAAARPPLRTGAWIALTLDDFRGEEWHARVLDGGRATVRLAPLVPVGSGFDDAAAAAAAPTSLAARVRVYDAPFDALTDFDKRAHIVSALDTLPSVAELRRWLAGNTGGGEDADLKLWTERVSPTALGVLRWIIASNRSCIVKLSETSQRPGEQMVAGMDGWTQFRFAMGAPDKEQRFVNAVKEAQARLGSEHPSIFAFHGSPITNWHSIIREGLHFNVAAHGRAYGHGCYHSLDMATSLAYSNLAPHDASSHSWPRAAARIASAMSLNEIVNAPAEFVAQTPHLVVQHLDWIQTRYLFVRAPSAVPVAPPVAVAVAVAVKDPRPLDARFAPRGERGPLCIPAGRPRRAAEPALGMTAFGMQARTPPEEDAEEDVAECDDAASVETCDEDLAVLLSDSDSDTDSDSDSAPAAPATPAAGEFIPDTLDPSHLPTLPPPSYASPLATKRLTADLNTLLKLQRTHPLPSLGFYLSPARVSNVYHWLLELHSFPPHLPLVADLAALRPPRTSIVLELRFGPGYPHAPPFVRVVTPRFRSLAQGGGGHVTAGGALCLQLLTNDGWSAVLSVESVLLQIRVAMCEEHPAARLVVDGSAGEGGGVYGVGEAAEAYRRACRAHGWTVPEDFGRILGN